jgi:hypothetical protein
VFDEVSRVLHVSEREEDVGDVAEYRSLLPRHLAGTIGPLIQGTLAVDHRDGMMVGLGANARKERSSLLNWPRGGIKPWEE